MYVSILIGLMKSSIIKKLSQFSKIWLKALSVSYLGKAANL